MKSTWVVTTAAPQISLDAQRAGELTFTVTNASRVPARAVFEIAAADGTDPAWFSVAEPQRLVQPGASVSVLVKVKVAADAAAGTYTVQGRVYSADEAPEEHSVLSGRVAVEIKPAPQPVAKSRP